MRRTLILVIGLLALGAPVRAEPTLVRLAEALAGEIQRAAAGRGVELLTPEDRTHRGGTLAVDLRDLVITRLRGRVSLVNSGARLVVAPVISETPQRVVVSARVVEAVSGRLVDLLSTSVERDSQMLVPSPVRLRPERARVEITSAARTPPLDAPPLDLALIGEDQLLVLFPDSVAVYRWAGSQLALTSRRRLPGPLLAVRSPAGMISATPGGQAFWVLTSRSPRAVLLELTPEGLVETTRDEAIPWPGARDGLTYRGGTHLLDGLGPELGSGSVLTVEACPSGTLAVSLDGRLIWSAVGDTGLRVGPALALVWRDTLAATSAEPPGDRDTIHLIALADAGARPLDTIEVEGSVRALAAREESGRARLVAGIEQPGDPHLLILELAPIREGLPSESSGRR